MEPLGVAQQAAGLVQRLLQLDALPPGSILAHGVHLEPEQVERARAAGLWLVQNPRSNRGNRVGYPKSLASSDRVALGTDGFPSDMSVEEQTLLTEAESHGDELDAARRRLDAGHNLVTERFGPRALDEDRAIYEQGALRSLVVAGREIVSEGVLLTGDLHAIRAEAKEQAQRLFAKMETL